MEKTLNFYLYEDDNEYIHMLNTLSEELKLTPEVGDNYIDANVVIPRRDSEALGRLILHKHCSNGYPIGRSNCNTIFDTCQYEVDVYMIK